MTRLVPPHGSDVVIPLLLPETERAEAFKRATNLKSVPMTSRETSDFLMLAMGAYTPLTGFMGHDDWRRTASEMKLANGLFWPIPITLSCTTGLADSIQIGETVSLVDHDSGEIMGTLAVSEKYTIDKTFECKHVF